MQRAEDSLISRNDSEFISKALAEGVRIDGRQPFDIRDLEVKYALDDCAATVRLGGTTVCTVVTATLEAPRRQSEGTVRFNVQLSPGASPAFGWDAGGGGGGGGGERAVELQRLVERALRESKAIDQEALSVLPGRKAWNLTVDVQVLDHCGNLADACCMSALAALLAFKRPQVEVLERGHLRVFPPGEREPLPLSLHHLPLAITFALFSEDGEQLVVDPCLREEASCLGSLTVVANQHGEVCGLHKGQGIGVSATQVLRCVRMACAKVEDLVAAIKKALAAHEVDRVAARVRRHRGGVLQRPGAVAGVMLQADDELVAVAAGGQLEYGEEAAAVEEEKMAVEEAEVAAGGAALAAAGQVEGMAIEDASASTLAAAAGGNGDRTGSEAAVEAATATTTAAAAAAADGMSISVSTGKRGAVEDGGAGSAVGAGGAGRQQKQQRQQRLTPAEGADQFEFIAGLIAGAGQQQQQSPVTDLAQAIKPGAKAVKKKKKSIG